MSRRDRADHGGPRRRGRLSTSRRSSSLPSIAFGQAQGTVARMLNLKQSVDSLEQMNQQMTEQVADFRENRPQPEPTGSRKLLLDPGRLARPVKKFVG